MSYAYQWEKCDALGEGCLSIGGATAPNYKLTASDVGSTVRVVVTASNTGGHNEAASVATGTVMPLPPTDEIPPSISGTAEEDVTLQTSSGTWTGNPTYAYQWEDCNPEGELCSHIDGATSTSYKLTASDVGHTIRVVVTASNAGGSTPATSKSTVVIVGQRTAPTNEVPPAISGSAVEGDTLTTNDGTWTGNPTSYAYQWEDCNPEGKLCSHIDGADSTSYKLMATDVGQTIRVVVTASNAEGHNEASSDATGTVVPPPPANETPPSISGSTIEGDTLTTNNGTWTGSPTSYAYQWEDCNSSGKACAHINGATSSSYKLAASNVGHTIRVVVTASNAGGHNEATSAATGTVVPLAPTNEVPPAIAGSPLEGDTLTTNNGTWTGSPTSYAYQWEDCNSSGDDCSLIGGGTSSSYRLTASDIGHTVLVEVKATNAGGTGEAISKPTDVVTAKEKGMATGCFENPESEGTARIEACGYPGPGNVGAEASTGKKCSELTPSGSITSLTPGQKIENLNITGHVYIEAANVTINNDCITDSEGFGHSAVKMEDGASDLTVSNSTIRGANEESGSVEIALQGDDASGDVATKDALYNCGECVHADWTLTKSYVYSNGLAPRKGVVNPEDNEADHIEDWYMSDETAVAKENTMLDPEFSVAIIFGDTDYGKGGPCDNHMTVEGNLVAGGDYLFYPCSHATSVGTATETIRNNRFARCLGKSLFEPTYGGYICEGTVLSLPPFGDSHGYFPDGAYYAVASEYYTGAGQEWSGNFWDDNLETVPETH
jgi:hypothetical protein